MATIVIGGPQNISLDGVVQDPDGQEGSERGGWFTRFGGADLEAWGNVALDDAMRARAWLLGRRSYEYFETRWRTRTGALADRINGLPKYVVSSTLVDPDWNSAVVSGDVTREVAQLKRELDGEIVVPASYQLGCQLLEHGLVDELRLVVFPIVVGAGRRLFGETNRTRPLRLAESRRIGSGLVHLTYRFLPDS